MKRFITLFFIIFIMILNSCKSSPSKTEGEKVIYEGRNLESLFDLIDSIRIVKLQHNDSIVIGNLPELYYRDSSFYIIDKQGTQKIYRFKEDGMFINSVGSVGRGAGEYVNLNDVYINNIEDEITVLSYPTGISKYFKDGRFKSSNILPTMNPIRFSITDKTYWLYLGYGNLYNKNRFLHVDQNMKVLGEFLPLKTKTIPVFGFPIFSYYKNETYVNEDFNNSIYQIVNDSLKEIFRFDFGSYNVTESFFAEKDPFKAMENIQNNGFANIRSFSQSAKYSLLETLFQKGHKGEIVYGLKNKQNNQWYWINYTPENRSFFGGNIRGFTKDDLLTCFLFGTDLPEFNDLEKSKFINPEILSDSNKGLDMYLFLCYLKK